VAIYTRVSTTRQKTENQLVQLWEYVARMGWSVAGILKETGHG
jgi:DNA invertase Pin-like site-specific DNA recombinase